MARTKKVSDLQINEDMEFQKRSWIIQRIGWAIFTLTILLAFLGLFGDGPLSNARAGQEGAFWLEYPRFGRFANEFRIEAHIDEGIAAADEIGIHLDASYLDGIQVSRITPTPDRELRDANGITYVFTTDGQRSPQTIYFDVIPQKVGVLSGTFQLQDRAGVRFSQFIYP
ncbi:MAG TPA: hypothetical protein VFO91_07930 [Anaerolineales bacterium]|nr:hypothetical protein [Anaerolineales bacterium]